MHRLARFITSMVRRIWTAGQDRLIVARWRAKGVDVAPEVRIAPGSRLRRGVSVGEGTRINGPLIATGHNPIQIGRWCAIGREVRLIGVSHQTHRPLMHVALARRIGVAGVDDNSRGGLRIGDAAWIGDRVAILPGVTIGNGAVVGTAAVVTTDVEPYTIVAGIPARPLRRRFEPEIVEVLEEVAWWNWDLDRMRRNRAFFDADLTSLGPDQIRQLVRR